MKLLILWCLLGVTIIHAQSTVFNSAFPGNLSFHLGSSTNYYSKSNLSYNGNNFDFSLNKALFDQPFEGIPPINFHSVLENQYKVALGYTIKRGVQLQLEMDNFQYQLRPQVLTINGKVQPGFDQIGQLSGAFNDSQVNMDTVGFNFAVSSAKLISLNFNLIQNLYRLKNRLFVLNGVYGLGFGVLHSQVKSDFGTALQNSLSSISGGGAKASAGLRMELFRHFYFMPTLSAGILFQSNMRLDINDASQKASQHLGYFQMGLNFGTVFHLGKKQKCDCPGY